MKSLEFSLFFFGHIFLQDMDGYESNGPLSNYFIHFKKEEEQEFNYTSVPSTIKSVVLSRLYRWTKYLVKVSSANRHGRCVGRTSYLDADTHHIGMLFELVTC